MSTTKLFIQNSASNYFILFLKVIYSILFVPILLNAYGESEFGMYILVFGLSHTIGFFDLGAGKSILKYAAEFKADDNKVKFQEAFSANITLNIISAVLVFLIIMILSLWSDQMFNIPPDQLHTSRLIFVLSAINGVVLFLDYIPSNVLSGFSYFQKRNILQLVPIGLNMILLYGVVSLSAITIVHYCLLTTAINLLFLICDAILLTRIPEMKGIRYKPQFNRELLINKYTKFSMILFGISTIGFLGIQSDRIILASVINISAVALYTIVTRPYFLLKTIMASSYNVIQPVLLKTRITDEERFFGILERFTRITFIAIFSVVLIISIFFEPLLRLWLSSDDYDTYAIWGIAAMINICIPMLYGAISRTLLLTAAAGNLLKYNSISILINFIVSILVTIYVGFQGVIIGTTVQFMFELFVVNTLSVKYLKFPLRRIFSKSFITYSLALLITAGILRFSFEGLFPLLIGQLIILLSSTILLFGLLNYLFISKTGYGFLFKKSYWQNLNP